MTSGQHVLVLDTRDTRDDEVPMQDVFMDNLHREERTTIFLVVCISDTPVKGLPTRESWTRIDLPQHTEATSKLTVLRRLERRPGNTAWEYAAKQGVPVRHL